MKNQKGGLLVEVLVSMVIGIFLMYGALSVMLSSKRNYLAREVLSNVQSNGRLAMEVMSSDIRMAGYRGCSSNSQAISIGVSSIGGYYAGAQLDPNAGIRGWEYTNTAPGSSLTYSDWTLTDNFNSSFWKSGGVDEGAKANVAKNPSTDFTLIQESDVLRLWSVESYVAMGKEFSGSILSIDSDTVENFPSGNEERLLIVSDCENSILVKATNFGANEITLSDLSSDAPTILSGMSDPRIMLLRMVQYTIEQPSGSNRPSLYRREMKANGDFKQKVEVLPGVMNMQLLFGENLDSDPDADAYLTASDVTDWQRVVSVRVWVFVESERDNLLPNSISARYYGGNYAPAGGDHRMRRGFSKTFALRNRMLGEVQ